MWNIQELVFLVTAVILSQSVYVHSHGRLIHPPQRSSAWRYGYDNPPNYNDNELSCGGVGIQWNSVNDGRCGACGDAYSASVKPNEDVDGLYVKNNVITGRYVKGQTMKVQVDITANHKGWFEFRLCPLATPSTKVTQECLNRTLLQEAGGSRTRFQLASTNTGIYEYTLQLPASMTCDKCVLQWKYNTGNSWGCEALGCGIGLGKQENFVNCADIEIRDNGVTQSTTEESSSQSQSSPTTTTTSTTTTSSMTTTTTTTKPPSSTTTTTTTTTTTIPSSSTTTRQTSSSTNSITSIRTTTIGKICSSKLTCKPTSLYSTISEMYDWCCANCGAVPSYCPPSHCICERY